MNTIEELKEFLDEQRNKHKRDVIDMLQLLYDSCVEDIELGDDERYAVSATKTEMINVIKQQYGS